jgi:arylsulfatase A-like enzyme
VYPTLVELCGLAQKPDLDGHSLVPLLKDPTHATPPVVSTFDRGNYSIRSDRWRYIRYEDGSEELYDHETDPHEWYNLAGEAAHAARLTELRSLLPQAAAPRLGPPSKSDGG